MQVPEIEDMEFSRLSLLLQDFLYYLEDCGLRFVDIADSSKVGACEFVDLPLFWEYVGHTEFKYAKDSNES